MYDFLLMRWQTKKITAEKLHTYVPFYITEEQYQEIIASPQGGIYGLAAAVPAE